MMLDKSKESEERDPIIMFVVMNPKHLELERMIVKVKPKGSAKGVKTLEKA